MGAIQRVDAPTGGSNQASWTSGTEAWAGSRVCAGGAAEATSVLTVSPIPHFPTLVRHLPGAGTMLGSKIQQGTDTVLPGSSSQPALSTQNLAVKSTAELLGSLRGCGTQSRARARRVQVADQEGFQSE